MGAEAGYARGTWQLSPSDESLAGLFISDSPVNALLLEVKT